MERETQSLLKVPSSRLGRRKRTCQRKPELAHQINRQINVSQGSRDLIIMRIVDHHPLLLDSEAR